MTTTIRLTPDEMERLAWAHPDAVVEFSAGHAHLKVDGRRYVAELIEVTC